MGREYFFFKKKKEKKDKKRNGIFHEPSSYNKPLLFSLSIIVFFSLDGMKGTLCVLFFVTP